MKSPQRAWLEQTYNVKIYKARRGWYFVRCYDPAITRISTELPTLEEMADRLQEEAK